MGAEDYASLAPKLSFYQETSSGLLGLWAPQADTAVVDLACGSSCIVTRKLLAHPTPPARIYCVDYAAAMLAAAERRLRDARLRFVVAGAEDLADAVPEPVDAVLCNSAFVLFDVPRALAAIARVLKPEGAFLFSIADWQTDRARTENPKYQAIAQELAARGLPPKPHRGMPEKIPLDDFDAFLRAHGFAVTRCQPIEIPVSAEDWQTFYSIPSFAKLSLPHLPVDVALDVLRAAMPRLEGQALPDARWFLYEARAIAGRGDGA
jgi:SAM-dependent methyltransferase